MKQIEKLLIEEFKKNNVNFDTKPMVDYVDDSFTDVLKSVIGVVKKLNYIPCCESDSEQLVFNEWKPKINFTKDKKYTMHSESDDKYLVQTDFGSIAWMKKKYFDKVMVKN